MGDDVTAGCEFSVQHVRRVYSAQSSFCVEVFALGRLLDISHLKLRSVDTLMID